MKRVKILPLILVLALLLSTFSAQLGLAQSGKPSDFQATGLTPDSTVSLPDKQPAARSMAAVESSGEELVSVIVKLTDAPLVTRANADGLDVQSAESQAYLGYLAAQQEGFISVAKASLSDMRVIHRYDVVLGGVSMLVPASQVEQLSKLPGVKAVYLDELMQVDTDASPEFIGAKFFWSRVGGKQDAGEGVVVGVLDTGIWPEHPSFADPDPWGNDYPAPPGTYGCDFGDTDYNPNDALFDCNNKLVGAYDFLNTYKAYVGLLPGEFDSARDADGHGTHTSSTAAGNYGVEANMLGVPRGIVSGIAPRAHVVMYKVCGEEGCYNSDSAAAVQQAILDGVDVLNFSISGGSNPFDDVVSLAFLDAYEAGVFVAASAGNSGPGPDTVAHREPWVTTVAASTHDRTYAANVTLTDGSDSLTLEGVSITAGYTDDVVLAAD